MANFAHLCLFLHLAPTCLQGTTSRYKFRIMSQHDSRMQESPERTITMTARRFARSAAAVAAFTAIVLAGIGSSSPPAKATDEENDKERNEPRIERGLTTETR